MIEEIVAKSYLKRLDNIVQWLERDTFNRESVSQHSFKVAVFTRVLLDDIFGDIKDFQIERFKMDCVTHAIFHDFDEAIFLRDVSHNVKYNEFNGNDVRKSIDEFVEYEFNKEFAQELENDKVACNTLKTAIIDVDPNVKKVVKVADWLALLYYCRRELALGNKNFDLTYKYCIEGVSKAVTAMGIMISQKYTIDTTNVMKNINKIIVGDIYGETDF